MTEELYKDIDEKIFYNKDKSFKVVYDLLTNEELLDLYKKIIDNTSKAYSLDGKTKTYFILSEKNDIMAITGNTPGAEIRADLICLLLNNIHFIIEKLYRLDDLSK